MPRCVQDMCLLNCAHGSRFRNLGGDHGWQGKGRPRGPWIETSARTSVWSDRKPPLMMEKGPPPNNFTSVTRLRIPVSVSRKGDHSLPVCGYKRAK